MRVLIFGDSITQGYWDSEGGWVARIRKHYDNQQLRNLNADGHKVFNLGVSADDSKNLLDRIENETRARTSKGELPIVVISIGTNDSSIEHSSACTPLETYRSNLEKIIATVQPISTKLIFVGLAACEERRTTPVSWGDFYYRNELLKAYEDAMKNIAMAHHLPFIHIFDAFFARLNTGEILLTDGLHPNNEGHQLFFELIQPTLQKLLS